jgi:cell division topological specificity factor
MSFIDKLMVAIGMKEEVSTASTAKDRLMVTVSHQRRHRHSPDYLPLMEKEILAVIAKYVEIEEDKVDIKFDRGDRISTLEVNVELPSEAVLKARVRKIDTSEDVIVAKKAEKKEKKIETAA